MITVRPLPRRPWWHRWAKRAALANVLWPVALVVWASLLLPRDLPTPVPPQTTTEAPRPEVSSAADVPVPVLPRWVPPPVTAGRPDGVPRPPAAPAPEPDVAVPTPDPPPPAPVPTSEPPNPPDPPPPSAEPTVEPSAPVPTPTETESARSTERG